MPLSPLWGPRNLYQGRVPRLTSLTGREESFCSQSGPPRGLGTVPSRLRSQPGGPPAASSQDESHVPGGTQTGTTLKGNDLDPAQNPPRLRIRIRVLTTLRAFVRGSAERSCRNPGLKKQLCFTGHLLPSCPFFPSISPKIYIYE